jgi:hypothetical protein
VFNSGNNHREQNWLLLITRVMRAESDWRGLLPLGVQDVSNAPEHVVAGRPMPN